MRDKLLMVGCFQCDSVFTLAVGSGDYEAWKQGFHAQDVFPYLSADERELLISSTCGPCFDEMLPEDEG